MKKLLLIVAISLLGYIAQAQVGINNTDPKASLDITATNQASPSNTDGILIPRIDDFPGTNPTTAQQGMMVYLTTTSGSNPPGFYYWDNVSTSWVAVSSATDTDWITVGSDIERQSGDVFIGNTNATNNDLYLSDRLIDWDNTSYFLDPDSNSRLSEIQIDNGNSSSPSLYFATDPTTGLAGGTNNVRVITGGDARHSFTNKGQLEFYYKQSILIGYHSGNSLSSSFNNSVLIGNNAGQSITSGLGNNAIGYGALDNATTSNGNNIFGQYGATDITTGSFNTGIGGSVLANLTSGNNNTAIGSGAGNADVASFNNTYLGYQAGAALPSANYNRTGNIFLGFTAGYNQNVSNRLFIENSTSSSPLIYGEFDNDIVRMNGELQVNDPTGTGYSFPTLDGTSGQVMTTDGAGQLTFTTLNNGDDADWYEIGTTTPPNAITDNMFTQGEIAIGTTTQNTSYNITSSSNAGGVEVLVGGQSAVIPVIDITANGAGNDGVEIDLTATSNGTSRSAIDAYIQPLSLNSKIAYLNNAPANGVDGLKNDVTLSGNLYSFKGVHNNISGTSPSSSIPHYGIYNYETADINGQFRGIENRILGGGNGNKTGMYNFFGSSAGPYVIGHHTQVSGSNTANYVAGVLIDIPSTVSAASQYGIYSDVTNSSAYSGYFLGRVSIGTTTANNYILPSSRGASGYVLQSGGGTTTSWVDPSSVFSVSADNGLTETSGNVQLGGSLLQNTTISQANFGMTYNLTGLGDFSVQDNGTTSFIVEDSGDVGFGLSNPSYQVDISETNNAKTRALNITKIDNTASTSYGIYNAKSSSGSSQDYGIYSTLSGSGSGNQYVQYNNMQTTGSSIKYAVYNNFGMGVPSVKTGVYNNFLSTTGNYYGMVNYMAGTTNSGVFGLVNTLSGTGTGAKSGVSNSFSGAQGNVNIYVGLDNAFTDTGNGTRWGVRNNMDGAGNGTHYGTFNNITGTGSGTKYGTYNNIDGGAGGTHYGTYNEVSSSNGWAGYFLGRNYISERLSIGETDNANASLNIRKNSTGTVSHIELEETSANDGARIRFTNASETNNEWVLYGRADNTAGNGTFNIYSSEISSNVLRLESDGKVGIMRNPSTNQLEVGGTASKATAGSWLGNSDRRLKKNIEGIEGKTALEKIQQMRGVTYLWNDTQTGMKRPNGIQYGFIAQELMKVFPEKVTMDNLGFYQTAYGDYDPIFVEAIKELKTEVETLSEENQKLKEKLSKYESLEARISALENDNLSTISAEVISEKKK